MNLLQKNPEINLQCIKGQYYSKLLKCDCTKEQIKEEFIRTYESYERLFDLLANDEVFYERPEPRRHPLIFYFGHTACVYLNKLFEKGIIKERLNAQYEEMFATGVDENDWDDMDETHYNWPTVNEVKEYKKQVRVFVLDIIDKVNAQICWEGQMWAILMGIQHERIHLQTSAVIIRQLPLQKIKPSQVLVDCPFYVTKKEKIPINELQTIPALKKQWDRKRNNVITYGWDNEFGDKQIDTKEYQVSKMLVSNGQFLEFFEENGYNNAEYWCQEGLLWLKETKMTRPVFWRESKSGYKLKTLNQVIQLPLDWPVEVNNLQASAFCSWKSKKTGVSYKLPTEDQYYAMRTNFEKDWTQVQLKDMGNSNLQYWCSPCPVNMFKFGKVYDVVGNLFQLTSTSFYPFKNFEYHPLYEDYSSPFFDGRSFIVKGGSFITNTNSCFNTRHWYRRHFYQFAGFRYAISQNTDVCFEKDQESDKALDLNINLHFCFNDSYVINVSEKIKKEYKDLKGKSLVVGCSVGRISLELSKVFDHSSGLDFTSRFFQVGSRMLDKGFMTYKNNKISIEGQNFDKSKNLTIRMSPINIHKDKLATYKMIVFDGFALRAETMKVALPNFISVLEDQGFLIVLNAENRNVVLEEQIYKASDALKKVESVGVGEVEGNKITMQVYLYQK